MIRRVRRAGAWVALTLGIALLGATALVAPAQAAPTLTQLNVESFSGKNTVSPNWVKPSGNNVACLTAGTNTSQAPIPGCQLPTPDAVGSGTLRLTPNTNSQVGTVFSTVSLPTAQGLDIVFNTYQYSTTNEPADGISFILAATSPSNPAAPAVNGPLGGSLGYSAAGQTPGVSYGYLGFGLDVFGNYENSAFGGSNCPSSSPVPNSIAVRGPGQGTTGYCLLGQQAVGSGGLDKAGATTRPTAVPVEIALNPASTAATTTSGLSVPANSWVMQVGTYNGTKTISGALPAMTNAPAGWVDGSGRPYQLTFGWAGSTGGDNEVHELNTLATQTVNGPLPVYSLAATDNENGGFLAGSQATVSVTPSLAAGQGSESQTATVTTTFPSGIVPQSGTFTTNGYSCTTTGQVVACTYTPSSAIAAGTSLPTAQIPVTVASSATAGSYTISSKVSSNDANPATATDVVTVSSLAATSSGAITYGANEVLSVTGLPAGATGSVAFTDGGGATLCTIADVTATTSCTVTTPAAGSYAVTASYTPGTGSPYAAQTASTTFSVAKAGAPFTAAVSPSTVDYGQGAVLSSSGLPADATGSVTFSDAQNTVLCTASLPTLSCPTSTSLAPGSYAITATYSGDANHSSSTATTSLTVAPATPTLDAAVSDPSVPYGAVTTLSVGILTNTGAGATAPTGTVTFRDVHGTALCAVTLPATSCQTSATLAPGDYAVTATYSGDANYTGAASTNTTSFQVTQAATSLTAGAASNAIVYGSADTLWYTGLPGGATGTVAFKANGQTLCTATLPAVSCTTSTTLPAGTYEITASYSGDTNFQASTSNLFTVTVGQHGSDGLTAAATPTVAYGVPDTLSYTGLAGDATGHVTFTSGSRTLCTATLPATSCQAPADLVTGHYPVTATYSGDANYTGSTASTAFDVTPAETAIAAGSDPSVVYGSSDTLSYSGITTTGPLAATGTVRFSAGGQTLCTATLPATSCTTSATLPAGHYAVTATYSGDGDHQGSAAATAFDVTPAPTAVTLVPASGTHGQTTTLTAAGLPTGGGTAATGTVTFSENGTVLCTATLPDTSCDAPASLHAGTHTVTVAYSGDDNHGASESTGDVAIARATFDLVATPSTTVPTLGQPVTIALTGIPADATGTVVLTSPGRTLCTIALPATSCTLPTALPVGAYPITVTYPGDGDNDPATATLTVTVTPVPHAATTAVTQAGPGNTSTTTIAVPSGPGITTTIVDGPQHGTASIVDGKLVYTSTPGYSGTDTVTYRVTNPDGSSSLVTITITVPATASLATTGGTVSPLPLVLALLLIGLGTGTLLIGRRRARA